MDLIGVVGRLEFLAPHSLVETISKHVVDPIIGLSTINQSDSVVEEDVHGEISLIRRILITWGFLYVSSVILYLIAAGFDFFLWFVLMKRQVFAVDVSEDGNVDDGHVEWKCMKREITMSIKSMMIMAGLSTPAEVFIQLGYSKTYTRIEQYGWFYLILSPILFLIFSDCIIYFIHRGLHHRYFYRLFHKPHHSFIHTTPFAAFAFHPVDGYLQGFAYHLFVFIMPFHYLVHFLSLIAVSCWTINIHDRVGFNIPGVNGAKHHRIHHITFSSNYGQYFTFWDRVCGTYKNPFGNGCDKVKEGRCRDESLSSETDRETKIGMFGNKLE